MFSKNAIRIMLSRRPISIYAKEVQRNSIYVEIYIVKYIHPLSRAQAQTAKMIVAECSKGPYHRMVMRGRIKYFISLTDSTVIAAECSPTLDSERSFPRLLEGNFLKRPNANVIMRIVWRPPCCFLLASELL